MDDVQQPGVHSNCEIEGVYKVMSQRVWEVIKGNYEDIGSGMLMAFMGITLALGGLLAYRRHIRGFTRSWKEMQNDEKVSGFGGWDSADRLSVLAPVSKDDVNTEQKSFSEYPNSIAEQFVDVCEIDPSENFVDAYETWDERPSTRRSRCPESREMPRLFWWRRHLRLRRHQKRKQRKEKMHTDSDQSTMTMQKGPMCDELSMRMQPSWTSGIKRRMQRTMSATSLRIGHLMRSLLPPMPWSLLRKARSAMMSILSGRSIEQESAGASTKIAVREEDQTVGICNPTLADTSLKEIVSRYLHQQQIERIVTCHHVTPRMSGKVAADGNCYWRAMARMVPCSSWQQLKKKVLRHLRDTDVPHVNQHAKWLQRWGSWADELAIAATVSALGQTVRVITDQDEYVFKHREATRSLTMGLQDGHFHWRVAMDDGEKRTPTTTTHVADVLLKGGGKRAVAKSAPTPRQGDEVPDLSQAEPQQQGDQPARDEEPTATTSTDSSKNKRQEQIYGKVTTATTSTRQS